ncbi:MAG: helix-turn-helix transcriptional regulator [Hyphomicrobiaceae bacterium]|nr:helix-turn-helix transcriptional regulator [Hyphomicrobiaceae bacterium]
MRSQDAATYQAVARPVAVMAKPFPNGARTGWHAHARGQVLYATQGLMLAQTAAGTWGLPTGHALLIPPGLMHDIAMHGSVEMLTAYVSRGAWTRSGLCGCRVVRVSKLLDAALAALVAEPVLYGARGRHLASLVLDEVSRAPLADLALPMPAPSRLRDLCERLIAAPDGLARLDALADDLGISRRTLTRRFRAETGISLGDWQRRLRQLTALRLESEGVAWKEIAASVGYGSPQALRAMLRRRDGATAGAARARDQASL